MKKIFSTIAIFASILSYCQNIFQSVVNVGIGTSTPPVN